MLPEAQNRDAKPYLARGISDLPAAGSRPQGGPDAGLVERVTTLPGKPENAILRQQICARETPRGLLKTLNQRRRVQRMRRVVAHSADMQRDVCQYGGNRYNTLFETLTYAPGHRWRPEHITEYIDRRRKAMRKQGIPVRYCWVAELQMGRMEKYGASAEEVIHYHVLWFLPYHVTGLPFADLSGLWMHGMSRIEKPRNPVGYMVKYTSKGMDQDMPRGLRLFGVGSPDEPVKFKRHRSGLPRWLDERAASASRCRRAPGGGWMDKTTGEIHRSPYRLIWGTNDDGDAVVQLWEWIAPS